MEVAQRAFDLGGELGAQNSMADPGLHVVTQVLAMIELGRLVDAQFVADVGYEMAIAQRTRTGQGWFALMKGRVGLVSGDVLGSLRNFGEASALLTEVGWPGARRWASAGRMLAAAFAGDAATCAAAAEKLGSVDPGPARMMEAEVVRARAWLAHMQVDEVLRDRLLDDAVAMAMDAGTLALAVGAWHDIARFGRPGLAAPALASLAAVVDGPFATVRSLHASALARNDADGLVTVAEAFEDLGALLFAAEALAAASAATLRAGSRRAADALGRRSLALAERCPGAATPALVLAGPGAVLTTREREVAALAAEGLASKEIAARLGRSVRTVDNHLQRAYQKLGVSSRDDLRAALDR
jgi:DNA-binding CsgD family transcriptional regulator